MHVHSLIRGKGGITHVDERVSNDLCLSEHMRMGACGAEEALPATAEWGKRSKRQGPVGSPMQIHNTICVRVF